MQIDYDQFKSEMKRVGEYLRAKHGLEMELSCRDVGVDCDFVARGKTEEDFCKGREREEGASEGDFPGAREKARAAIHLAARA